jgi:hypothetical protein
MIVLKRTLLKALIFSLLYITACKSWDPNLQFENDVKKRNKEMLLLENKSQMERQSEFNLFINFLTDSLSKGTSFLNWAKSKSISYKVTAHSTFKNENWETREYKFSDLVIARYGFNSKMINFYRKVNKPSHLSFITNGVRCINPVIY